MAALAGSGFAFGQRQRREAARSVPVGVATTDFRDQTNQSLAEELKSQRVRRIQLFFTQKDSSYCEAMMKIGGHMGVHTFLSEMGHWHPEGPAPAVAYDWQDDVWKTAVATGKELARIADANGATVLLEPIYRSLLASAKRTRLFLEEVGSQRVRAQLDPANLLEVNDLEEMFSQLKPWIGGIHAKDRKLHVTAGAAA